MSRIPAIGERCARGKTGRGEPFDHRRDHGFLTAMEVGHSAGIDHHSVRRIGCHDRGVTLEHPQRQLVERRGIGLQVRIPDDETRNQNLRLGHRHAGVEAGPLRGRIRSQHHPPPSLASDQDERRFSGRCGVAQLPSDPIRRPGRKEERDDPAHRKPPLRNRRFHRRGSG